MYLIDDLFFDLVFSQVGLIMKSTRSRMLRSRLAAAAGLLLYEVQYNRHLLQIDKYSLVDDSKWNFAKIYFSIFC